VHLIIIEQSLTDYLSNEQTVGKRSVSDAWAERCELASRRGQQPAGHGAVRRMRFHMLCVALLRRRAATYKRIVTVTYRDASDPCERKNFTRQNSTVTGPACDDATPLRCGCGVVWKTLRDFMYSLIVCTRLQSYMLICLTRRKRADLFLLWVVNFGSLFSFICFTFSWFVCVCIKTAIK